MINLKKEILSISLLLLVTTVSFSQRDRDNEEQRPDGPPNIDTVFKHLDTNEDNKISLEEVKGPLKKDFSKIDTNEDGFITKEELEKAPKPERKERR